MKRKMAFALLSVAAIGVGSNCFTWGQDSAGGARVPRASALRVVSGDVETVEVVGGDVATVHKAVVETARIDSTVESLVKELKAADGVQKESVLSKLMNAVGEQFDRRQEGKAKELKELEEQLAKLKEVHAKRTQQRDRIVSDRVKQIVNEVEGLGWGTDTSEGTGLSRFGGEIQTRAIRGGLLGTAREGGFGVIAPAAGVPSVTPVAPVPPTRSR